MTFKSGLLGLAFAMGSTAASAATLNFQANLSGDQEVPSVVTSVTGFASLSLNTVAETLSVVLSVNGLNIGGLFDTLVAAPVGPIHLHNAPAGVNGPIVVPFPFGATYIDTDTGFDLIANDISYASAAALAGSSLSFSDFVGELQSGGIYFNVHSDFNTSGEIRGQVSAVPIPASIFLLFAGLGGMAMVRARRA